MDYSIGYAIGYIGAAILAIAVVSSPIVVLVIRGKRARRRAQEEGSDVDDG